MKLINNNEFVNYELTLNLHTHTHTCHRLCKPKIFLRALVTVQIFIIGDMLELIDEILALRGLFFYKHRLMKSIEWYHLKFVIANPRTDARKSL